MAWPCDRCGDFAPWFVYEDGDSICVPCQLRARAIRAVVAAQWAVAIAATIAVQREEDGQEDVGDCAALHHRAEALAYEIGDLPTPEQIADGALP